MSPAIGVRVRGDSPAPRGPGAEEDSVAAAWRDLRGRAAALAAAADKRAALASRVEAALEVRACPSSRDCARFTNHHGLANRSQMARPWRCLESTDAAWLLALLQARRESVRQGAALDEVRRRVGLQRARVDAAVVGRRRAVRDLERRKEMLQERIDRVLSLSRALVAAHQRAQVTESIPCPRAHDPNSRVSEHLQHWST